MIGRQATLFGAEVPAPPQAGRYRVISTDHPWPEHGGGRIQRGADRHYPLMRVADCVDISRTFGAWAADDAHLYTWATNNYLPVAFECIKAAGFRYVTTCTWIKDKAGLGQYYRGQTEHCLFAVRGRLPYRIVDGKRAQGLTVLYAPDAELRHVEDVPVPADLPEAFEAPRTRHSKKPAAMRRYMELVSGEGPRLECFAIEGAPGWDAWGNGVFRS